MVGFVGVGCSFAGKFFGGYARGKDSKGNERNYCLESKKNLLRQSKNLSGLKIYFGEYDKFPIPQNSIIYCDPPYKDTTKYSCNLDYDKFYNWCRNQSKMGHRVYVSEYWMPEDFECIWCMEVNSSLDLNTGSKRNIEKLFKI